MSLDEARKKMQMNEVESKKKLETLVKKMFEPLMLKF